MNRNLFYSGIALSCFGSMSYSAYRKVGLNNFWQFIHNMFTIESIFPMAILGALQVKCLDTLYKKYLE